MTNQKQIKTTSKMAHHINGEITAIMPTNQISEKFKKRDCVVRDADANPDYPQYISLQFTQDKVDYLDNFKVGDAVTIDFNLRGREWTSPSGEVKYFNTLEGWRIVKAESGNENVPPLKTAPPVGKPIGADDDLPF